MVRYSYDAWGNHEIEITSESYRELAEKNPFRYRSYYYDVETGLYYLQTRYYDPEVGRFITIDGIEYIDPETINGLNLYAYCGNNPVMYTDPDGTLKWWQKLLIGLAFIVVGAVVTALTGGSFLGALVCGLTVAAKAAIAGAAVGLVTGGISAAISGGNILQGMLSGAFNGAVDGFMWGGISAGLTNIIKPGTLCFIAGTKVLTADGQKNIEEIAVGDRVLAYNEETGKEEVRSVTEIFRNKTRELAHVTVDGEEIVCTVGHRFYTKNRGWIRAEELREDDILLLYGNKSSKIERLEKEILQEEVTVYNFEVEGLHNYFVSDNSVLVHNTGNCGGTLKGSNNPNTSKAAARGREIHKNYDFGPDTVKEVTIPGYGRADAVDYAKKIVYELKPNNPRAIARGYQQLSRYTAGLGSG